MGLFGSSTQKKLEKARAYFSGENYYDALLLFEELREKAAKLSGGELSEVESGSRQCRERMMRLRLDEAEALRLAGDLSGARDRCGTAADLAAEDLDRSELRELLRRIDAPHRPVTSTGEIDDATETDLLPESEDHPAPSPLDRYRPEEEAEPDDEELFGEDSETLFEINLSGLEPETAEYYRSLGPDFHHGYLAVIQGAGRRALDFFERLQPEARDDPRVRLERAHALLLARRGEDSLAEMDQLDLSGERWTEIARDHMEARRRYLTCEALRLLGRYEEAVSLAEDLAERAGGMVAAESLLAWTLIEAGRAEEAYTRIRGMIDPDHAPDELITPAAAAAESLGLAKEEMGLLEMLLQKRILHSASMGEEIEFPVQAGRRLLQLYVDAEKDADSVRALLLHLIDHDPENAEEYRELLLETS